MARIIESKIVDGSVEVVSSLKSTLSSGNSQYWVVKATDKDSGVSVEVEGKGSQHYLIRQARKKLAKELYKA